MNTIRDGWGVNPGISTRSAERMWYISPCDPPTGPKVFTTYYAYANKDFTGFESEPKVLFQTKNGAIDNDILKDKPGIHRQVCIDRMSFNSDGTIKTIHPIR